MQTGVDRIRSTPRPASIRAATTPARRFTIPFAIATCLLALLGIATFFHFGKGDVSVSQNAGSISSATPAPIVTTPQPVERDPEPIAAQPVVAKKEEPAPVAPEPKATPIPAATPAPPVVAQSTPAPVAKPPPATPDSPIALLAPAALHEQVISLFNGRDLTGWKGLPEYWSVKDGAITGRITERNALKFQTFLVWQGGTVADFELSCRFKLIAENTEGKANSGIDFRASA